jgi:mRNA interferase RelE/StbE
MLSVKYSLQAEKYFKKIRNKQLLTCFEESIETIRHNPRAGTIKSGDLAGIWGYDVYYDGTNYEIAYTLVEDKGKYILVILAGTRENFYNSLKKYLR